MAEKVRCSWCGTHPIYVEYHDKEWGVPVYDDKVLFEFITLEGAQAGLNWITILKKRDEYRKAFCDFDVEKVARLTTKDRERILKTTNIVRNRLKVESTVKNAQAFMEVQEEFGSFSNYQWCFTDHGEPVHNGFKSMKEVPAVTPMSEAFSKDLKSRGFNFVGPTIMYAYMQAVGMVNDHSVDCFRYQEIKSL